MAAVYDSVCGPAAAAVRLLALDPFAVHSHLADLAQAMEVVADEAARLADGPLGGLPALAAPLLDLSASCTPRRGHQHIYTTEDADFLR